MRERKDVEAREEKNPGVIQASFMGWQIHYLQILDVIVC